MEMDEENAGVPKQIMLLRNQVHSLQTSLAMSRGQYLFLSSQNKQHHQLLQNQSQENAHHAIRMIVGPGSLNDSFSRSTKSNSTDSATTTTNTKNNTSMQLINDKLYTLRYLPVALQMKGMYAVTRPTKIEMKAMVTEIWHVWDCTRKREHEIHRHQIANCIHSSEIQQTVSCKMFSTNSIIATLYIIDLTCILYLLLFNYKYTIFFVLY